MERMPGEGPQPTVEEYLTRIAPKDSASSPPTGRTPSPPPPDTLDGWVRRLTAERSAEAAQVEDGDARDRDSFERLITLIKDFLSRSPRQTTMWAVTGPRKRHRPWSGRPDDSKAALPDPLGIGSLESSTWVEERGNADPQNRYWRPMSIYSGAWLFHGWETEPYGIGRGDTGYDKIGLWLTRDGRVFALRGRGLGSDRDFVISNVEGSGPSFTFDRFDLEPVEIDLFTYEIWQGLRRDISWKHKEHPADSDVARSLAAFLL